MEEDGKILVSESSLGKLYLYFEEFGGINLLHMRYWVRDRSTDEWIPGRKGLAIPESKVPGFLDGLLKLLKKGDE